MSASQLTLDDIWLLFKEVSEQQKETSQQQKENSQQQKETGLYIKEMVQENRQRSKETSKQFEKTSKQFNETKRQFEIMSQETDRKIQKVSDDIGKLGNRLGEYVEEMVRPAAVRLFRERGIDVHEVHQNISSQRNNEGIEVDLLVVNETDVVAIECKSNFSIDDVNEHLERLDKFKRLLPMYINKKLMGAITGMVLPENVARYAYKKGLFVITQTGEHLIIRNDQKFIAQAW